MKPSVWRCAGASLLIGAGLAGLVASQTTPSQPKRETPSFEAFAVTPDVVCANIGLPLVEISWKVKGDGESCVSVSANGEQIFSEFEQPWFPEGLDRCGEDEWEGSARLNLQDVFGNNIPSSLTFTATLEGPFSIGAEPEEFDAASDTIEVRVDCEFNVTPGG
ncbi:MAG TPA: hypothetical protein VFF69_08320 [Phycisphaerales bacterium]|nr:hypothetical protein [Phycisphaerales bacterium]